MRRDLIIGLAVSLAVHGGTWWIGEMSRSGPPKPKKAEATTIQLMQLPPVQQEEQEVVETDDMQSAPQQFAPPMQADVPSLNSESVFTQQVEPPPPSVNINKTQLTVPKNTGNWMNGMRVFNLSDLDQQPQATFRAPPNYPFEMRRAGITGTVVVDFIVGPDGQVIDAHAVSSTNHEFEAAAVQGVVRWRFRPGRKGGKNVATHMEVPIQFNLNSDS